MQCPERLQTPALLETVAAIREQCAQRISSSDVSSHAVLDAHLLRLCALSPYIARTLRQFPDILPGLLDGHELLTMPERTPGDDGARQLQASLEDDYQRALATEASTDSRSIEALQQRVLRWYRHRHMVRILWCDLTGVGTLEQTLLELSLLAQCCVMAADQWSFDVMSLRFGRPLDESQTAQRLIIIGMGKLGGFELNVSSDIDLIFIYPSTGTTHQNQAGQKTLDNGEFFRRSAQRVSKLLNTMTSEGFVYRVDTRLRPFGESGPLVMNLDGLENYYLTQARDWERYAMIKGRALCGNAQDISALNALVTPFVYRRYLDYNAFDSLRELKRKIAMSLLQRSMANNIKLGAGGIREIEFIGQAFQLVRGGRESRLRIRPILKVLTLLAELELLSVQEVEDLHHAYAYLRRVENAIQMMRDEQLHTLPVDEEDQQRLLCMLGESDWVSLTQCLAEHQAKVSQCFTTLFESQDGTQEAPDDEQMQVLNTARDVWAALAEPSISDDDVHALMGDIGYAIDESLMASIRALTISSSYHRLTAESQRRVERLVPLVLVLARRTQVPAEALARMLELVRVVAGRGGYLQVLCNHPSALEHLVTLFSQSRWLAGFVAGQPIVIDELLTEAALQADAAAVHAEMNAWVERLHGCALDEQMDLLRQYRQAREMRIACAQLDGSLSLMQVSDQLSWLAESIIAGVIALVRKPLEERFGKPVTRIDDQISSSHLGVLAYGKLGGLELGFSSDLDLVFVHDSEGSGQYTDGLKSVDNSVFYARLAQKFVHFMSTNTPAGVLYKIDLRLRPNGSSGVLVTGIGAFANYQQSDAWTWEHQALMRARMVYGVESLRVRFDAVRQQALARNRPAYELRTAVAGMRKRMRQALGNTVPGKMHLKQDAGGIADIEFIVQYLVLAHAFQHPSLLMFTDNIRVLDLAEKLQLLPADQCQTLRSAYLLLRERLHRRALDNADAVVALDAELATLCESVTACRVSILGESSDT